MGDQTSSMRNGSRWAGYAASLVHREIGIPYVVTEHMSNYAQGKVQDEQMPLMRETFAQARMRLPISESTGETLEEIFGDDFRPWTAVPNMVDDALFADVTAASEPSPGPFTFFTVGRHDPIKGYDVLLKAFAAKFKGENVRLRLGGSGQLSEELKTSAAALGIDHQVDFLGALERDQVAEELSRTSAYVLSSHYETFGIPILEAQAFGVPVVATACGGPQQLVDATNGILVDPSDCNALAEGMLQMTRRQIEFDRRAIRERCLATYSPQAVLDQLEPIYEAAVGS